MKLSRLFRSENPVLSEAGPDDALAVSLLHAASFRRGWSEDECERLLVERNVLAHRATMADQLVGFVMSRLFVPEAEILSIAVATSQRGQGVAHRLLDLHLKRLAEFGVRTVFLEVDESNEAARRLYNRFGFANVGSRPGYYPQTGTAGTSALVLRRDVA
jgi:[ribosomal protein S18]-alanine N-acetyltransferase